MNSRPPQRTYQVGFRRPPKETQFKAGRSGNPNGRPKGALNIATVLKRTLEEKVVITENGRRYTITKFEALMKQLINKAASGDIGALRLALALVNSADEKSEQEPVEKDLNDSDQKIMQRMLQKLARNQKENKNENDEK